MESMDWMDQELVNVKIFANTEAMLCKRADEYATAHKFKWHK